MAQSTDLVVPNTSGAGVRSGINTRLQAIATHQSGATAPATTYAYQFYADTTAGLLKQRDGSNANWISLGTLGAVNLGHAPVASPTFTGTVTIPAGATIAGFAPLTSPTFLGTPAAPTAAVGTSTTQLATTAFVQANGAVKAWVNFNGTGTVAIRASFNVSSITDGGIGTYTVNFTTALADANYVISGFANGISAATGSAVSARDTFAPAAGSCQILSIRTDSGAASDTSYVQVAFFR